MKEKLQFVLLSDKFYRMFLAPFDKILFPVIPSSELKINRENQPVPINKVPNVSDIYNPQWQEVAADMKEIFKIDEKLFHRKIWESIHLVHTLKNAGFLHQENKGLAVGAGREEVIYYLTHKVARMTGIDLYEGSYVGGEDEPDIPEKPTKYAPFFYPPEKLELLRMDARKLDFPDNHFDFVLSLSSIEHFGSLKEIGESIMEMYRVLKPGGGCLITSEIRLNRLGGQVPNTYIFTLKELLNLFQDKGFQYQEEDTDIQLEEEHIKHWVKLPHNIYQSPHVILRLFRTIFTSMSLLFIKPGDEVSRGEWVGPGQFDTFRYEGIIEVTSPKKQLKHREPLDLKINLKNTSNFDWHVDGYSHRIAVHIKLLKENGDVLNHFLSEIIIPDFIPIGQSMTFDHTLPLDLAPGRYKLFFDLKKERVLGFSDRGNPPSLVDIVVE